MSILGDSKVGEALTAAMELAAEPLGFTAGILFGIEGSTLRCGITVGVAVPPALLAPGRVGDELIGRALAGPAVSRDLESDLAPARAEAARALGLTYAYAVPLGSPAAAILCLLAREAPPAVNLERVERAMSRLGALVTGWADDKYRALVENLRQIVIETDADGRFIYLNPAWTALTGHSVEATLGQRFTDLLHPDDQAASWGRFVDLMGGQKQTVRPEVRYRFADGSYHWIEVFAHAVPGPDGAAMGTIATFSDVGERHSAFEALRSSEENLRRLLELSPEPVLIHEGGTVVYVNPAFVRACGREHAGEVIGTDAFLYVAADDLPTVREIERRLAVNPVAQPPVLCRLNRPDGAELIIEAIAVPLPGRGKPLVMILGRDVTSRVRADEALRRAKDTAERAARSRSEFLANISHELRTPLHGILGMTELTLDSQLDEDQRGQLRTVHECGVGLLGIIDDILDFSKMEAGKMELEQAPFELWDVLGAVMRPLAATATKKGLELVCHVDPDVPTRLVGDGGRLRQLFFNLVGNAIKFTEQGEVAIEISRQGGDDREVTLCARVVDQGIGIPPEKRRSIFEAFEQADNAVTRRHGGTGLGLALCAQLVGALGGRIWVDSTPGEGSTFHVTVCFPVAPPVAVTAMPFTGSALVVAKSARVRAALVAMLGPGATEAAAADAALRSIWVERPALVVLEASQPGAHDVEAAARRAGSRLLLLVAPGAARPDRLGTGSVRVVKPALAQSVRAALAGTSPSVTATPARMRPLTILLAEDNEINRRLMVRYLERLGHNVTAVENGQLVLAAIGKQRFELILMDVQMPELDGLTTTRIIRAREAQLGGHIPIVALTAHALGEHRDQCLTAGMDDFLVKPLPMEKLHAVLARIAAVAPAPTEGPAVPGAVELDRLRAMVGDDPEAIPELASLFIAEAPRHKVSLRAAFAAGDATAIIAAAHKAKASFIAVAATAGAGHAGDLERRARAGSDLATLAATVAAFEGSLDAVCRFLAPLAAPPPPARPSALAPGVGK